VDVVVAVEKCVVLTSSLRAVGYKESCCVPSKKEKKELLDEDWPEST
jgi:hypothetical protein